MMLVADETYGHESVNVFSVLHHVGTCDYVR